MKNQLGKILGFTVEMTENFDFGDYFSNVAMTRAKEEGGSPKQLAEKIISDLKNNSDLKDIVEKIEVAGPGFINFWLKKDVLIDNLIQIDGTGEKYGDSNVYEGQIWGVEHTSPNPNKAMHLGHLRNNVTGMAVANLAEAVGVKVVRDCVDNNRGIAIAKLMWGYLKFAKKDNSSVTDVDYWFDHQEEWQTPQELGIRPDRFVDQLYVKGSSGFDSDKNIEKEIRDLVVSWESEDKKVWALWKKVLDYSYEGQKLTLDRLGNKWDVIWHEHEHYKAGKDLVMLGIKKGIFKKLDDGAVITDLSNYKLPDTVVIKSDGTALYITQDLALTRLKKEKFGADRLFWVIGPEQSLAMQQMFSVCEQLEIGKVTEFKHLAYGYMSIKGQGKMSSRLGNVVYIDDLLDIAKEKVRKIMSGSDFDENEIEKTSETAGVGAVKYSILKVGRLQDIAFDVNESVSLEGNSGPYLQYTVARTNSVLNKTEMKASGFQNLELNKEEMSVLRTLIRFPDVILESAENYSPNLLCNYLYDLASKFNTFYNKHRILESKEVQPLRVALTKGTCQVLKNGLKILGIQVPERM